jgi:hypothetical protein
MVASQPSVVATDAPSAVRAQDAAPAAYLLAALGLVAPWRLWTGAGVPRAARRAARAAAGAALALALALNLWLYFLRLPGDPRVLGEFYVGETRAGYAIAAARARDPALIALLPPATLRDRNAADVLRFAAGDAPLAELPAAGALPAGPLLLVVPRGEDRAAFARDLAAARGVAAAAGLREAAGEAPPGGDEPTYVIFARD